MTPHQPEIIIVKRRAAHEDGHHGGAWKIAFADFMTAMMAFFLVLWIISATDKNTKTVIARYFNPVKVEEPAKAQKGIHGVPEKDASSPRAETGPSTPEKTSPDRDEATAAPAKGGTSAASPGDASQRGPGNPETNAAPDLARPNPTMSEQQLFSDPRASLDKIDSEAPGPRIEPSEASKGYGEVGPNPDESLRDPFRPLGSDAAANVVASDPGGPPPTDAGHETAPGGSTAQNETKRAGSRSTPEAGAPGDLPSAPPPPSPDPAEARKIVASKLLADLRKLLGGEAQPIQGPQLDVQATEEGVLISLTDRENFAMFAIGSAEPQPRVLRMMDVVAASLKTMPGAIVVRGHTDAHPYRSPTYDNWRLSSARAQMAYYMLSRAGMPETRFERIEGFADHDLKDAAHPFAAENRRIEILVREVKP